MADATALPTSTALKFFYWQGLPNLVVGLSQSASDTTVYWSARPTDEDGNLITGGFVIGVKNKAGRTERIWVPLGAVDSGGYFATGCVRGIDPAGLDYTTGHSQFIEELDGGSTITCVIAAQDGDLIRAALQGLIATGANAFTIGVDAGGTVTIYRATGPGTKQGFMRWLSGSGKVEYSNDGTTWNSIDSVTASNLVVVTGSDTTPSNLNAKIASGTGITKAVLNPGANEQLQLAVNGTLAQLISDVTVTATNLNAAVNAYLSLSPATLPVGFYTGGGYADFGTLGDAVSASDITNNLNLVYQLPTDQKWYKVTSSQATGYNHPYKLALVLESGIVGAQVRILLEGKYANQNFTNINPSFTGAGTGFANLIGHDSGNNQVAILLNNSTGAEYVTTGVTLSLYKTGTPGGNLQVALVLASGVDQAGMPASYFSNAGILGAVIATADVTQASLSGLPQNIAVSWGGSYRVPAGMKAFVVLQMKAAPNTTNYYNFQSGTTNVYTLNISTWSSGAGVPNYTLAVTSTSPVGYSVKAYGSGTNGGYSINSNNNALLRPIGNVVSTTEFYFSANRRAYQQIEIGGSQTASASFISTQSLDFCYTSVNVLAAAKLNATTPSTRLSSGHTTGQPTVATTANDFLAPVGGSYGNVYLSGASVEGLSIARLETGFYAYTGYATSGIGGGAAGFTADTFSLQLNALL